MKKLIYIIFVSIFLSNTISYAQIPGVYPYYIPSGKSKSLTAKLDKKGILPKDVYPFKIVEYEEQRYFIFQKNLKRDVRAFKILKENEKYYILCNEDLELCDCKSGTFLYFKSNYQLQRIQKPFSFSMKNNLISRLRADRVPFTNNIESMTFCEILHSL